MSMYILAGPNMISIYRYGPRVAEFQRTEINRSPVRNLVSLIVLSGKMFSFLPRLFVLATLVPGRPEKPI